MLFPCNHAMKLSLIPKDDFSSQFLADKPKLLLLVPSRGSPTSPSPFTRQAVHHFYQFLQIPHSNKVLGLCCIESLCDKAELTSLIIVKVTLKKNFIILIYFVVCMFGMSPAPPLWFGVYFLGRTALLLKEDLISRDVPQVG